MSPNRTSEQGSVWGVRAALTAPLLLRASNKTLFCVLAGCPLESRPVAKRPRSEPTRRGGMPPSTLAPPPEAREGARGRGAAGERGACGAGRVGGGTELAVRLALPSFCARLSVPTVPVLPWQRPPYRPGPGG